MKAEGGDLVDDGLLVYRYYEQLMKDHVFYAHFLYDTLSIDELIQQIESPDLSDDGLYLLEKADYNASVQI